MASFVEIHSDDDNDDDNETPKSCNIQSALCDAYVAVIEPKQCSALVKRLAHELPLPSLSSSCCPSSAAEQSLDFSHLKRVKRPINSSSIIIGNSSTINVLKKSATDTTTTSTVGEFDDDSNKRQKMSDVALNDASAAVVVTTATTNPMTDDDDAIPCSSSKNKMNQMIGVLLGPVSTLDRLYGGGGEVASDQANEAAAAVSTTTTTTITTAIRDTTIAKLKALYNLTQIIILAVPRRLAESEQEHKLFNSTFWPCLYFPKKTRQYKKAQLQLSDTDLQQMEMGIEQALQDALECQEQVHQEDPCKSSQQQHQQQLSDVPIVGTVVVSPANGQVVARASQERALQASCPLSGTTATTSTTTSHSSSRNSLLLLSQNPLQTSVVLALQGVSRLERQAAIANNGMQSSSDFATGQYLCTGYDLYTTLEPSVMDAMAMVHARVRRVIFGCGSSSCLRSALPFSSSTPSDLEDYATCGLTRVKVHKLPGTNHKYRAFMCRTGSKLWNDCRRLSTLQPEQEPKHQHPTASKHKGHNDHDDDDEPLSKNGSVL